MKEFVRLFWEIILVGSLIAFLCLVELNPHKIRYDIFRLTYLDKIVHFSMFFGFSITILRSYYKAKKFLRRYVVFTVLIALAYGIIIEILQYFYVPTRAADILDVLANLIGALCGVLIIKNRKAKKSRFII